ncbi:MAG: hypothetical protein AAGI46_05340 [Planctomycetota bacterium]
MLRGHYHITVAWAARGRGFADSVTDDGWTTFYEQSSLAADAFARAHAIRPDLPDAAGELVNVAMGAGRAVDKDEVDWFEASTAAQIDWLRAWDYMLFSERPRWGGTHETMIRIGNAGVATRRFDTAAPYQLFEALELVVEDYDGDWRVLRQWSGELDYEAMYDGLIRHHERRDTQRSRALVQMLKDQRLVITWAAGEWDEAATLAVQHGSSRDVRRAFRSFGHNATRAMAEIEANASPQRKLINEALLAMGRGEPVEAAATLEIALDQTAPGDAGRALVESRLAEARFAVELMVADGEWVDVPSDLLLFDSASGDWSVEDDDLIGTFVASSEAATSQQTSLAAGEPVLVFNPLLRGDFEIEASVETDGKAWVGFMPLMSDRFSAGTVIKAPTGQKRHITPVLDLRYDAADDDTVSDWPVTLIGRLEGDLVSVWVEGDDDPTKHRGRPEDDWRSSVRFALVAAEGSPGDTVRFSKLRIRMLPKE